MDVGRQREPAQRDLRRWSDRLRNGEWRRQLQPHLQHHGNIYLSLHVTLNHDWQRACEIAIARRRGRPAHAAHPGGVGVWLSRSDRMIRWRVSRLAWAMTVMPLLLVPALVMAQRGIGGGGRGRGGGGGKEGGGIARDAGIAVPKLVNAVNLLVEHKQDLALTDTQFVRIIALKRSLDSTNAPLMRRVDSVQREFKGGAMLLGNPSPARRDSLAIGRSVDSPDAGRHSRQHLGVARQGVWAALGDAGRQGAGIRGQRPSARLPTRSREEGAAAEAS